MLRGRAQLGLKQLLRTLKENKEDDGKTIDY